MNVSELLEVLGNETRRKILELLSRKPCYVSELSQYLRVAPKALLEHLEKLENAGIISSFEEGKRKYYYIAKSLSLYITITPHLFRIEFVDSPENVSLDELIRKLNELESSKDFHKIVHNFRDLSKTISCLHFSLHSQLDNLIERTLSEVEKMMKNDVDLLIFASLLKGMKALEIVESFGVPYREVEKVLKKFTEAGFCFEVSL